MLHSLAFSWHHQQMPQRSTSLGQDQWHLPVYHVVWFWFAAFFKIPHLWILFSRIFPSFGTKCNMNGLRGHFVEENFKLDLIENILVLKSFLPCPFFFFFKGMRLSITSTEHIGNRGFTVSLALEMQSITISFTNLLKHFVWITKQGLFESLYFVLYFTCYIFQRWMPSINRLISEKHMLPHRSHFGYAFR